MTCHLQELSASHTGRGVPSRRPHAKRAFDAPRFSRLYRYWLREGHGALEDASSTQISEALATGAGRLECLVLAHRYDHLSPLVDVIGSPAREAETANNRSDEVLPPSRPPNQPVEPEFATSGMNRPKQ